MDNDPVRLGEAGWKGRYYQTKMSANDETAGRSSAAWSPNASEAYTGCCRYCCGLLAGDWYYPYHYAPFATDLVNLHEISTEFDLGEPFRPFRAAHGRAARERRPRAASRVSSADEGSGFAHHRLCRKSSTWT